jgi:hypothetical protein
MNPVSHVVVSLCETLFCISKRSQRYLIFVDGVNGLVSAGGAPETEESEQYPRVYGVLPAEPLTVRVSTGEPSFHKTIDTRLFHV